MDNIFLVAGFIAGIFFLAKFFEMRYVDNEAKPLKFLIRDTLLVYVSVIFGSYIIDQLSPVINETVKQSIPIAFTDNPSF
jgi:hypothetical protein